MKFKLFLAVACFAANSATPFCSAAEVAIDNVEEPTRATTDLSPSLWAAQSFITGTQSHRLSSLDVLLGNLMRSPNIAAELRMQNGPSKLGTLVTTFAIPSVSPGSPALVSLIPNSSVTLKPTTTYWLVLGVSGAGSFGWSYAEGNATAGPGSLAAYAYSSDGGVTWPSETFNSSNPYKIRVNVRSGPCGPVH